MKVQEYLKLVAILEEAWLHGCAADSWCDCLLLAGSLVGPTAESLPLEVEHQREAAEQDSNCNITCFVCLRHAFAEVDACILSGMLFRPSNRHCFVCSTLQAKSLSGWLATSDFLAAQRLPLKKVNPCPIFGTLYGFQENRAEWKYLPLEGKWWVMFGGQRFGSWAADTGSEPSGSLCRM